MEEMFCNSNVLDSGCTGSVSERCVCSDTSIKVMDSAVSPSNVKINLFDYSLGDWTNSVNNDVVDLDNYAWWEAWSNEGLVDLRTALRDGYINYNHALVFGKAIIDLQGENGIVKKYNGVDPWGIWNWCDMGDTMARQGIVQAALGTDGYPVLNLQNLIDNYAEDTIGEVKSISAEFLGEAPLDESLAYLFDPDTENRIGYWKEDSDIKTNDAANEAEVGEVAGKEAYTDVKGLLQYGTYTNNDHTFKHSFYYDSRQNYARYDNDSNSFVLYSQPRIRPTSVG